MPIPTSWHHSLAARYGAVMVAYMAAGSLLLLTWLSYQQQEEARLLFVTVAKNDVEFVQRLNLPRSAKLANDLQRLLRLDIHFRKRHTPSEVQPHLPKQEAETLMTATTRPEVQHLPSGREALVLSLDAEHDMIFIREPPAVLLTLWHPATVLALLAFWLFSAVLAWVIGRQVVGPVSGLTRRLRGFFTEPHRPLPETQRRDEIGGLARTLSQARDELLEERRRREQSERLALLGRVATGLAHEIKNPLASIQLHAQLVETADLAPDSQTSLRHLLAEVRVIESLVNQWLYLARPAAPRKQTMDPQALLQETVEMLAPQAEHADVTMLLPSTSPEPLPAVHGDRQRLQQVFRNILLNAIQAMPAGGQIRITLVLINDHIQISFQDEGPGFTAEALGHGAELFFSEKEGGMGVGLNVVQEIISAHHGKMMLKNHPEGGALVQITLPVSKS